MRLGISRPMLALMVIALASLPTTLVLLIHYPRAAAASQFSSMPSQVLKKKKLYHDTPRTIVASFTCAKHPLNVCPLGNLLLAPPPKGPSRKEQLGYFGKLPEDLMMTVLGFVDDAHDLKALSHTSRVFYAYLYDEEVWKKHYISKLVAHEKQGRQLPLLRWRGSWRLSVLSLSKCHLADLLLPPNLVCSDMLYRPFQCSQISYETLFSKVISEEESYHKDSLYSTASSRLPAGRIQRFQESVMTQHLFDTEWHQQPFILTNPDGARWPHWSMQSLLHRFADVRFRQEAVRWPLSLYSQYLASNADESPLYLFDCNSDAMKALRREYSAPEIFQTDYFRVFGDCRPDHAWLIIGSSRSGSTFHKDPNSTSAWNTAISGRKLWVMFPPGTTPPGVSTDEDESEVTSPVGVAEWVLSGFYNDAARHPQAQIAITFPGECMYVPSGWWHLVINFDDTIALTQNFVPRVKLGNALHFLKNKSKQISGFRPQKVRRMILHVLETAGGGASDQDMDTLRTFCHAFDSCDLQKLLQDEDCGEILESQLPPLPVFELFKKLMIKNHHEELLMDGLAQMERKEKMEQHKIKGKSEAWEKLTETSSFSFGFSVSDEE